MLQFILILVVLAEAAGRAAKVPTLINAVNGFNCATLASGYYCHWDDSAPQSNEYYYVQCNTASSTPSVITMQCPQSLVCYQSSAGSTYCGWPSPAGSDPTTTVSTPPPAVEQKIPGGISRDDAPMLVYFSIDDAITPEVYDWSIELFRGSLRNPNGCPLQATYNVIEEDTVFSKVRELFDSNMEIASHSVSHRVPTTWWESATKDQWKAEITGMRDILQERAGINASEIRGMRSPFLVLGGNNQFDMLHENGFTYDTTMVTRGDPLWPFKLLNAPGKTDNCTQNTGCPRRAYPDLWEIPLNPLIACNGSNDIIGWSMVDACRTKNYSEALRYLRHNFYRHYNHQARPPLGLNLHFSWFKYPTFDHNLVAVKEFLNEIIALGNVWVVSSYQIIQWMESPTTHAGMMNGSFVPVNC